MENTEVWERFAKDYRLVFKKDPDRESGDDKVLFQLYVQGFLTGRLSMEADKLAKKI